MEIDATKPIMPTMRAHSLIYDTSSVDAAFLRKRNYGVVVSTRETRLFNFQAISTHVNS